MIRAILLLTGFLTVFGSLKAQHRQVLLGDSLYRHYSYAKAVKHYEKALKKVDDPIHVHERLANCYYKLRDYDQALTQYEQAISGSKDWSEESRWNYLHVQRSAGNDEAVRKYVAEWASLNKELAGSVSTGIQAEYLYFIDSAAFEVTLTVVNTDRSEFAPAYYQDGLVFASSRKEGNASSKKYHWDGGYYLDLYYAPLKGGPSVAPTPVGANTTFHDGPLAFYDNDRKVIFTRNEPGKSRDGLRTLVLMHADVLPNGSWVNIEELSLNDPGYSLSHPAITADMKRLYFVSDMPGGHGGTDIWYSERSGDHWGQPVNMGPEINTAGNEMFPYLRGDEFFFASDGHPGLGGLDIFIAEEIGKKAFMIRNAGYPLNTSRDDFGLITRNGREGFFSSNRAGQDDIYSFIRDKTLVDIFYVDEKDQSLDSVSTEKEGRKIMPTGDRTHLLLPVNSVTGLHASRENYADTAFSIETGDEFYLARTIPMRYALDRGLVDIYPIASEGRVDFYLGLPEKLVYADEAGHWERDLDIVRIEDMPDFNMLQNISKILDQNGFDVVVKDTISAVFFDFDKHVIRSREKTNLDRLISLLDRYPASGVVVSAHTDIRGSNAYNDKLAERRAISTRDYLIANGISSERITMHFYGERKLWIECSKCTEEEHQLNRRAVFGVNKEE